VIDVAGWLEAYRRAWEDKDSAAAAALFTEDGTYRSNIFEEPHQGQDGVFTYWSTVTSTQSAASVKMGRPYADGNRVAVEFWTTMASDGADITLPGCLLLEFAEDGRCRRLHEYWQIAEGTHSPPPEWGA
jgi:predicted SnoaL-like aldol condensation-catalyzing enzyme